MRNYILIYILFVALGVSAQGEITIVKDSRIDNMIKKQGEVIPPATGPQMAGYRVQLFFDSNKDLVDQARMKFVSSYPKVDTYVTYNAPNYILKVGDFRTKMEAEKIKTELEQNYPTSFIVKEKINLPRID